MAKYQSVEVRTIAVDCGDGSQYPEVADGLSGLDVGILGGVWRLTQKTALLMVVGKNGRGKAGCLSRLAHIFLPLYLRFRPLGYTQ